MRHGCGSAKIKPLARFAARQGELTPEEFERVKETLVRLLNLQS